MTIKQELFVAQYLIDFNATKAAIRAGYSEDSAYSQGQRLLKNDEIEKAVDEHKKSLVKDADSVVYANIAYWQSVRDDDEAHPTARLKASELLGKYGAMFTEKVESEHTTLGPNGNKIGVNFVVKEA